MDEATLEHVHNILLYFKKDASETAQLEEIKNALELSTECLEYTYETQANYGSIENTDLTNLGLRVLSYDGVPKQDQPPVSAVTPTRSEAEKFTEKPPEPAVTPTRSEAEEFTKKPPEPAVTPTRNEAEEFTKKPPEPAVTPTRNEAEEFTEKPPEPAVISTRSEAKMFNKKGDQLLHKKMWVEALDEYGRAIELNPKHPIYFYNRGNTYFLMEEYELCIDDCLSAIKRAPTFGEAWGQLGFAYYKICEFTKSRETFLKAIELVPTNSSYKIFLKKVEKRINNKFYDSDADSEDDNGHPEAPTQQHLRLSSDEDTPSSKHPADDSDA